jgi:hypothetical protein
LVVDDSVRHNPNLKAQIWQDLQGVMPALLRYGFGKFLLYALKFSPLPTQLVQLLQREAAQGGAPEKPGGRGKGQSPEEQAAKVQKLAAEAEKIKAQTENLRADRGLKMAKVVIEGLDSAHTHEHNKELQRHRTLVDALKMIRTRKMGAAGENFSG